MRTLELNKTKLWHVEAMGEVDVLDEEGYNTGEKQIQYTAPRLIRLHLYPAGGDIVDKVFGKEIELDMVTNSDERLNQSSLLFLEKPESNFDTTYTYVISAIAKSLNTYQYGLKGRL